MLRRRHGRGAPARARASEAVGESFNVGNARSAVTIYDLAQRIKRLTGCPGELVFQPLHYTDVELRVPNVDKARELLGFEAKVELDEGLERTIAWYRERKLGKWGGLEGERRDPARAAGRRGRRARRPSREVLAVRASSRWAPKVAELEAAVAEAVGTAERRRRLVGHRRAPSRDPRTRHRTRATRSIVPAYTFPATANVVELCGARAVLVDVDPDTFLLARRVEAARSRRARSAVLGGHLFGRPADWEALPEPVPQEIALLEDAAGALGARGRGTPCGSLGIAGCLSFHPGNRDDRRRRCGHDGRPSSRRDDSPLRHHGCSRRPTTSDARSSTIGFRTCCARSASRSSRLEELLVARERVAGWYTRASGVRRGVPRLRGRGDRHGWQAYVVQLDRRDEALAALRGAGIEAQIGTWALHRLAAYRDQGSFPGADALVRASACAAARDDDHRGRGRARRGGLDSLVSEC